MVIKEIAGKIAGKNNPKRLFTDLCDLAWCPALPSMSFSSCYRAGSHSREGNFYLVKKASILNQTQTKGDRNFTKKLNNEIIYLERQQRPSLTGYKCLLGLIFNTLILTSSLLDKNNCYDKFRLIYSLPN